MEVICLQHLLIEYLEKYNFLPTWNNFKLQKLYGDEHLHNKQKNDTIMVPLLLRVPGI